jgi:hypothetical protein
LVLKLLAELAVEHRLNQVAAFTVIVDVYASQALSVLGLQGEHSSFTRLACLIVSAQKALGVSTLSNHLNDGVNLLFDEKVIMVLVVIEAEVTELAWGFAIKFKL